MLDLPINLNDEKNIISGYNFAKNSDVIFSEILTHKQYSKILDKTKLSKVFENKDLVSYVNRDFTVKENDIIFSTTHFVEDLFTELKNLKNLKNIKLITHQSDEPITKSLFLKKPECISKWYSTNVDYKNDRLIPLPLGISNNPVKNPMKKDFSNIKINKNPEFKMYINFNVNTNYKERERIYKYFSNKDWVVFDDPNQSLESYIYKLNKYKFILSPWGNGYETHRFWEALYAGSIPITKYHISYGSALNLPAIFVNDYKEITHERLVSYLGQVNTTEINYKKVTMNYWINEISEGDIEDKNIIEKITFSEKKVSKIIDNFHKRNSNESRRKKIYFRLRQIKKILLLKNLIIKII